MKMITKLRSFAARAVAAPFQPLFKSLSTRIKAIVVHEMRHLQTEIKDRVEEEVSNIDQSLIAECFHPSDIAEYISIDLSDLAEHVYVDAEDVAANMDTYEVASNVDVSELAGCIDPEDVANRLDLDDEIATAVRNQVEEAMVVIQQDCCDELVRLAADVIPLTEKIHDEVLKNLNGMTYTLTFS
tara:strand:+ start:460 stop:1014 length:555 start_codon:yes stop_codon:yes gene_type:complete